VKFFVNSRTLFYLFLASFFLGFSFIIQRFALRTGADFFSISLYMALVASILSIPLFLMNASVHRLTLTDWRDLILVGILAGGITILLQLYALTLTSTVSLGLSQAFVAIFTAWFGYLFLKERLPKAFAIVFGVMVIGMFLVSTNGQFFIPNFGDILVVISGGIVGFTNVYVKRLNERVSIQLIIAGRVLFGTLFLLLAAILWNQWAFPFEAFEWIVLLGFFVFLSSFFILKSIETAGATLSSTFLMLAPVITAFFSMVWFNEWLSVEQAVGVLIILIGGFYISRRM